MHRKASDREVEIRPNMKGGKGEVKLLHSFADKELESPARLCAEINIEPGNSIGVHTHENEEEIFYIIEGTAKANDNGEDVILTSGDSLLTGGGRCHGIENIGNDTLRLVAVVIRFS
jgi:mannose-6-phosphate isomerase-like protein (cupin superfamily)